MLTSNDPQTIIRTARKTYGCDCHLRSHHDGKFCQNVIRPGDRYPEYTGESLAYQSGHRFCPDCRKDQLGSWISE